MKIFSKIKNEISALLLPIMLELPLNQKTSKPAIKEEDLDIDTKDDFVSEEDQIKFAENAIEYNPENKKIMSSYYEDFRNEPKEAYVLGITGLRRNVKDKGTLGNKEPKVKRAKLKYDKKI